MVAFEVVIRPLKALQALSEARGNRIGADLVRLSRPQRIEFCPDSTEFHRTAALAPAGALWQEPAAPDRAFLADSPSPGMLP